MKKRELLQLIEESFYEVLTEMNSKRLNEADDDTTDKSTPSDDPGEKEKEPQPENEPDMSASADTVLQDATDQILTKFPTLKSTLTKLQTQDFRDFISTIDYISPRPTSFRINLKNGQNFILKWMGKGFEAQILGKHYYLPKLPDYQQALDKLAVLYREGPFSTQEEEGQQPDFNEPASSGGGGGGDFPGGEGGGEESPEGGEEAPKGGEEAPEGGEEEEHKDLSGEKIDFENPGESPKK